MRRKRKLSGDRVIGYDSSFLEARVDASYIRMKPVLEVEATCFLGRRGGFLHKKEHTGLVCSRKRRFIGNLLVRAQRWLL